MKRMMLVGAACAAFAMISGAAFGAQWFPAGSTVVYGVDEGHVVVTESGSVRLSTAHQNGLIWPARIAVPNVQNPGGTVVVGWYVNIGSGTQVRGRVKTYDVDGTLFATTAFVSRTTSGSSSRTANKSNGNVMLELEFTDGNPSTPTPAVSGFYAE